MPAPENNPNSFMSHKWSHYHDCYAKHFPDNPRSILEIGIAGGGSLLHWRKQFPDARIAGLDIDPNCRRLEKLGFEIFIGSQADTGLMRTIGEKGPWDVVIDDGVHRPNQILCSFECLWPTVSEGGVYVIEDLQMSEILRWQVWQRFLGGPRAIVMKLYREMYRYVPDGPTTKPHTVHLYPHVAIITKVDTATDVVRYKYESTEKSTEV